MSYIEQMMENSMRDNENLSFNLSNSTILVRLTASGEEIIKRLDPTGALKKNNDGYYEIFSSQLFALYGNLLMYKNDADISDLVSGPILIDPIYLKKQDGLSIKNR